MRLRHLLIKIVTPLVWAVSEKRKLAALQEFSDTELDSGWQSLYALEQMKDPKVKAELCQHCLEEFYHAEMFASLLGSFANAPLNRTAYAREAILKDDFSQASLLDFLAQVYVGESEINSDFKIYAACRVDEQIRELFERIKQDEEGHEEISWEIMVKFAGGDAWKVRRLVWRKRVEHAWKRYVNFSQLIGNTMLALQLSVIYFVVGGFFTLVLRRRLALDRDEQLEILRQQLGASARKHGA